MEKNDENPCPKQKLCVAETILSHGETNTAPEVKAAYLNWRGIRKPIDH